MIQALRHDVLKRSKEVGRGDVAALLIGNLFAHSPDDPEDNIWPHKEIRILIDELNIDEIGRGLSIERYNMRGMYSKAIYEGGGQERDLAKKYYDWAKKCKEWPVKRACFI